MNKEQTLNQIKKDFDKDLKKKLNPIYDISTSVHENTLSDLKELFEAVGNFAYEQAERHLSTFPKKEKETNSSFIQDCCVCGHPKSRHYNHKDRCNLCDCSEFRSPK